MSNNIYKGQRLDPMFNHLLPEGIDPYLPDAKLVKAVQLAQILNRPLLVKGEPGCGKSRLAEAVAFELFESFNGKKVDYKDNYFEWNVKSSSKASEGLYTINYLERLQNANLQYDPTSIKITLEDGAFKGDYIELGPLGKAFTVTCRKGDDLPPPVVLIDEIDKADIDFPNDLLLELDKMKFEIPEIKDAGGKSKEIEANQHKKPLIIITSNDEKPLPAAFLRRCLFHFIDYPKPELMQRIVEAKFPKLDHEVAEKATKQFDEMREKIKAAGTSIKNISTSELLDWVKLIFHYQTDQGVTPDFTQIQYEQALAKDVETLQVFMKYNEEIKPK
jgi:MoxR-like ATPase